MSVVERVITENEDRIDKDRHELIVDRYAVTGGYIYLTQVDGFITTCFVPESR